ncbi:MAG: glycosyltransferase family 2 protein [bacterium]
MIALGVLSAGYYFAWWFDDNRIDHPALLILFVLAVLYTVVQVFCAWYIYWHAAPVPPRQAPSGLSVDVFVPTYDEPLWLAERMLRAAIAIRYPHQTYLIDDGRKKEYGELAEQLGAHYLSRPTNEDNKAGNVNYALARTKGEFVAIFDIDHVPQPDYLDRSLGHFDDPKIGFVQVILSHDNDAESFVAGASSQRNNGFFGAPMLGLNGIGCAQAFGSNCIFRRRALESIDEYKPGLAEDLHTSIRLHAAGWRSAYVPEALAHGLEPADLASFFKQQLKWSRGIFTILKKIYPCVARRLSLAQNIGYLWRLSCYLAGPMVAVNILAAILVLFFGSPNVTAAFTDYLVHGAPLAFIGAVIGYSVDKKYYTASHSPQCMPFGGLFLAYGAWPIYTLSFICELFSIDLPFIATPKEAKGGNFLKLVAPQIVTAILLTAGAVWRLAHGFDFYAIFISAYAMMHALMHSGVFYAVGEGWQMRRKGEFMNKKSSKHQQISRKVAIIHAGVLAMVMAAIGGGLLFIMTAWLLIKGGKNVGMHLKLLGQYLAGYSITWTGSFVGLLYGALLGGVIGWSIGFIYNRVVEWRQQWTKTLKG